MAQTTPTQTKLDDYILDTLLRDLTGHDHRPAAFLTYLWLAGEQTRRRSAITISYQELAENTGLPPAQSKPRSVGSSAENSSAPLRPMSQRSPATRFSFRGATGHNPANTPATSLETRQPVTAHPARQTCCKRPDRHFPVPY
jgi:hypothetical protein